jgi:alkylhydroperoxidase family enzyme
VPVASEELALRYLLELSADIRVALLVDRSGELAAAAPEPPSERTASLGIELARAAWALANGDREAVELDVSAAGGSAFCVGEDGRAIVCVTGPFALPGLVLHDMRLALDDLRRAAPEARS